MPEVFLTGLELGGRLPKKCLVCGEACKIRSATISYQPMWFLMMFTRVRLTRYMNVKVPLCSNHSNYFKNYSLIVLGGVALIFLMACGVAGTVVLFVVALNMPGAMCVIVPLGMMMIVVTAIAVAIVRNVTYYRSVYTNHIQNGEMRLYNVSQEFFDALEKERDERGVYDDERPRKKHARNLRDDEDDLDVVEDD